MKRINSLNDLLMEELAELFNGENQLVKALPRMVDASQSITLKDVLQGHLRVTKDHVRRLHDIFRNCAQHPPRMPCEVIKMFIEEGENVINEKEQSPALDADIISVAQRMEEYEFAKYQTAYEHAGSLGYTWIAEVFDKILKEEREIDFHLNELAQHMINIQVIEPKSGGFYIPEKKFSRGGIKKNKNMDASRFTSEGEEKEDQN